MIIERDLSVPMDDGFSLKAAVYRPDTTDPAPAIMTHGPYGKGVMYQEHYKIMWDWMVEQHPDHPGPRCMTATTGLLDNCAAAPRIVGMITTTNMDGL